MPLRAPTRAKKGVLTRKARCDEVADEEGPPEWDRFLHAMPRDRFVPLVDVEARLRLPPTRWSSKKIRGVYEELLREKELLTRPGGLVAINNALNRG